MHTRAHDVLTLTLFFFRRYFVDNLLLFLEHCLLDGCVLLSMCYVGLCVATLQGREKVVQKNTLPGLNLAPFCAGILFPVFGRRSSLLGRLAATTVDRLHVSSAQRSETNSIDMSAYSCLIFFYLLALFFGS